MSSHWLNSLWKLTGQLIWPAGVDALCSATQYLSALQVAPGGGQAPRSMLLPSYYPERFLQQTDLTCPSNSSIENVLMEAIDILAVSLYLLLNKLNLYIHTHDGHASQLGHRQHLSSQVNATMRRKRSNKEFSIRPALILLI